MGFKRSKAFWRNAGSFSASAGLSAYLDNSCTLLRMSIIEGDDSLDFFLDHPHSESLSSVSNVLLMAPADFIWIMAWSLPTQSWSSSVHCSLVSAETRPIRSTNTRKRFNAFVEFMQDMCGSGVLSDNGSTLMWLE